MIPLALQRPLAWAEDRALLKSNPSADPGAKIKDGATHRRPTLYSYLLRDWHQSDKPSRHDAATLPTRRHFQLTNTSRPKFQFPLNQDTAMRQAEKASQADGNVVDDDRRDERIQRFASFISSHSHILQSHPDLTIVQAHNLASGGAIVQQAERLLATRREPWISRDPRPPVPPIKPACIRTLEGHTNAVTPDGKHLVSASWDQTVRVWDVRTGACIRTLEGHTGWVNAVAITPDGKTALSASDDRTLRVWDLKTGTMIAICPLESSALSVAAIANKRFLVRTEGGQLHFLTLRNWPENCRHFHYSRAERLTMACWASNKRTGHLVMVRQIRIGQCTNTIVCRSPARFHQLGKHLG